MPFMSFSSIVSENAIGPDGAKELAELLPQCPNLEILDLACLMSMEASISRCLMVLGVCIDNQIGDEGMQHLAPALRSCIKLNTLDFGCSPTFIIIIMC